MMIDDQQDGYRAVSCEDGFKVVDQADRAVMQCRDEASANHYADMLNAAFRAGFKVGFRAGKASLRFDP